MRLLKAYPLLEQLQTETPADRREFFRHKENFKLFWYYHFPQNFMCDLAPFHDDWIEALTMTDLSILFEAFRGSLKTELIKVYLVYCICYTIEPYIVIQSYDSDGSEEMVRNVAKMLISSSIVTDYGNLFPFNSSKEDFSKKSITNFDTTNGVKMVSRSLGEKLRGASTFDEESGSSRPTLLILDDIDVIDSVRNVDIIDKNEQKIKNETIGAMSKERARVLFLWNTILEDGIVRRFYKNVIASPFWKVFRQPLFDIDGKTVWDFFTSRMIEKIMANEGKDAFNQNYLLIPKNLAGMPVFDLNAPFKIQEPYKEEEWFKLYSPPSDSLSIGIDIAEGWVRGDFSTITARHENGKMAFQFKDRCNEFILAEKLNFILEYQEDGKNYVGKIIPENNVGLAFINVCRTYQWFHYVVKEQKMNNANDYKEWEVEKYGFRTTATSKDLIIREYKIAVERGEIWISEDTLKEIRTYQYDRNNRANAIAPDHDDLLISDMIAFYGVKHIDYVVSGNEMKPLDYGGLTPLEKLHWRLSHPNEDPPMDDF